EPARRARVRELADAAFPHALGELHRLLLLRGGLPVRAVARAAGAGAAAGVASAAGGASSRVRTAARADHGDYADEDKGGPWPSFSNHVCSIDVCGRFRRPRLPPRRASHAGAMSAPAG